MYLPTVRHLKYLVALNKTHHFGKAAIRCSVTQPTLSVGIKELENQLGVQLFERTKRHVIPTEIGLDLAARAENILRNLEGMVEQSKSASEPLSGPLRLGAIPTIGPFILPRLLPLLRKNFPDIRPYLREDQSARLLMQLAAGELDVIILALPYDVGPQQSSVVGEDRFYLAVPATHRLANRRHIKPHEVPNDELLLLEEGHCLRDHVLAACNQKDSIGEETVQGTSLYTLVQMVASGLGVTIIPHMALNSDIMNCDGLAVVPLSKNALARQIGLVWRNTSGRESDFKVLCGMVADML